jgi:hypothetical protein
MVSRTRPSVPVEVLLNHRGQQQQAKLLEKERRLDSRAQQLRETAARMNPISERLAARKMAKEGVDGSTPSEVRLSGKAIGHVKSRTLQAIQEPSFRPTISKGSRDILAARRPQTLSNSIGNEPVHYRRFHDNQDERAARYEQSFDDHQWVEEEDEEEEEAGPYVDERMVYGERFPQYQDQQEDSPVDWLPEDADWYGQYRSDPVHLSDDRLFDPSQHSLLSRGATMMSVDAVRSSSDVSASLGNSMYSRSKQWDDERQRKREKDRLRQEQEELAQCSFKPTGLRAHSGVDSTTTGDVSERQAAWALKRFVGISAAMLY